MTAAPERRPDPTRSATVLVVADGDLDAAVLRVAADRADRVVAADGAAARVLAAGRRPDLVVGDGDSLLPADRDRLLALGVAFRDVAPEKDESDTELCLLAALEAGATSVSIVGALGGPRPEHTVANLLLLADPRFDGLELAIVTRRSRLTRVGSGDRGGRLRIDGRPGDFVSLFALGGTVESVTTDGLRFPLRGERLTTGPARGLSNELTGEHATVTCERGRLLVVHTTEADDQPADPQSDGGA